MKEIIIKMYDKQGYSPVGIAKTLKLDIDKVMVIIMEHFYPNGF